MPPVRFQQIHISDEWYESAGVFDVNNDGVLDIVSGAYWYPGPNFDKKCKIGPCKAEGEYFDDFSTIPMDVNGDGYLDFRHRRMVGQHDPLAREPQGRSDQGMDRARDRRVRQRGDYAGLGRRRRRPA